MANVEIDSGCKVKCWLFAGLMGVLVFWMMNSSVAFWMALLAGICVLAFLVLMLTRLCHIENRVAETAPAAATAPRPEAASATSAPSAPARSEDYDGDGVLEGAGEGKRPEALSGPRDGKADDLKQIKGVGPKLETMLNGMGFYHFDQIAGWNADEVAWVNANLQGFKGRVSRDGWQEQARILAAGGETEFSKRVEDGDVY